MGNTPTTTKKVGMGDRDLRGLARLTHRGIRNHYQAHAQHSQSSHGSLGAVVIICRRAPLCLFGFINDKGPTRGHGLQWFITVCNMGSNNAGVNFRRYRCFTLIVHTWKMSRASMCSLSLILMWGWWQHSRQFIKGSTWAKRWGHK